MLRTKKTISSDRSKVPEKPKRVRAAPRMSEVTEIYDGKIRIFRTTHSGDVWQIVQAEELCRGNFAGEEVFVFTRITLKFFNSDICLAK